MCPCSAANACPRSTEASLTRLSSQYHQPPTPAAPMRAAATSAPNACRLSWIHLPILAARSASVAAALRGAGRLTGLAYFGEALGGGGFEPGFLMLAAFKELLFLVARDA